MFCTACGTKFVGKFCPNCGTKVAEPIEATVKNDKSDVASKDEEMLEHLRNARDIFFKMIKANIAIEIEAVTANAIQDQMRALEDRKNGIESKSEISIGKVALAAYTCGLSLIATGVKSQKKKDQKEMQIDYFNTERAKLQESFNECENQIEKVKAEANEILSSEKWLRAKAVIPEKYFHLDAVPTLIEYFTYGRANTWKEACNIYEDELCFSHLAMSQS